MIIDSHHHFWRYTPEEFGWIPDNMAAIRRDYLPEDLEPLAGGGVISVQSRQTLDETAWLLELAGKHRFIRGVVGWIPLVSDTLASELSRGIDPKLVGVRHVVQAEPAGFLLRNDFNRGIRALKPYGLAYDILVLHHQLPEAIKFVDLHPGQTFILDHLGRPDLQFGDFSLWKKNLKELSRRANVSCKIAGGLIESEPTWWTPENTRPFLDAALEIFSPGRLMFGSNWPLTEAAGGYNRWLHTIQQWAGKLSAAEQQNLFSGTATRVYRLDKKQ